MMSSCCTLRLKRRRAFSRDSLSWIMTSATLLIHPQSGSDWYLAAPLAGQASAGCVLLRAPPLVLIIACIVRFAGAPGKVAGIFYSIPAMQVKESLHFLAIHRGTEPTS